MQAEKRGLREPKVHDGLIEVVGFSNGYQAGAVMAGAKAAVRPFEITLSINGVAGSW